MEWVIGVVIVAVLLTPWLVIGAMPLIVLFGAIGAGIRGVTRGLRRRFRGKNVPVERVFVEGLDEWPSLDGLVRSRLHDLTDGLPAEEHAGACACVKHVGLGEYVGVARVDGASTHYVRQVEGSSVAEVALRLAESCESITALPTGASEAREILQCSPQACPHGWPFGEEAEAEAGERTLRVPHAA